MSRPQLPTIQEIAEALKARTLEVAERFAPGGRVDGGRYWAFNPGRTKKKIGSFYVNLTGPYAGRFHDHATGEDGDMLDLIRISISGDARASLIEARAFLGMNDETPAQKRARLAREAEAKARRERAAAEAEAQVKTKRGRAHAMFISAQAELAGTPVAAYLQSRAIGLDVLPRAPGAIRYMPRCKYFETNPETGEFIEDYYPAMITAIYGPARPGRQPPAFYGIHRTYLAQDEAGVWRKAAVASPKKVFGSMKGGFIRLWSGIGPRGGKGAALSKAPMGDHVYITEGIEDGLSMAVIKPEARVLVAISLGNFREVQLPETIRRVTIVADNDEGVQQMRLLDQAHKAFLKQGREVTIWKNTWGGKDLNDAVILAAKQAESAGAA